MEEHERSMVTKNARAYLWEASKDEHNTYLLLLQHGIEY
jgi:hypothetical protein